MLLIVSVLFWIGFSRLPLEGVYRLLAILGTLIGVSLFLLLLQKDVIAGYMSAVNGVRSRLNEAYDGTLALYQASASAMQMTVFSGLSCFCWRGCYLPGSVTGPIRQWFWQENFRCWQESELPEGYPPFSAFF